jgi:hypothetical protein
MECPLPDNIILRIYGEKDLNVILYGNTETSIDQVFIKDSNRFD